MEQVQTINIDSFGQENYFTESSYNRNVKISMHSENGTIRYNTEKKERNNDNLWGSSTTMIESLKYFPLIDYSKIVELLYKSDRISTTKSFKPSFSELHSLLLKKEYKKYNIILENIDTQNSTELVLIGLLRLAYPWQNNLSNWNIFLNKVAKVLSERGKNVEEELRGLI